MNKLLIRIHLINKLLPKSKKGLSPKSGKNLETLQQLKSRFEQLSDLIIDDKKMKEMLLQRALVKDRAPFYLKFYSKAVFT